MPKNILNTFKLDITGNTVVFRLHLGYGANVFFSHLSATFHSGRNMDIFTRLLLFIFVDKVVVSMFSLYFCKNGFFKSNSKIFAIVICVRGGHPSVNIVRVNCHYAGMTKFLAKVSRLNNSQQQSILIGWWAGTIWIMKKPNFKFWARVQNSKLRMIVFGNAKMRRIKCRMTTHCCCHQRLGLKSTEGGPHLNCSYSFKGRKGNWRDSTTICCYMNLFREICIGYFCHVVTHLPKSGEKRRWSVYTVLFKWWQICESWMFRFHPFGTSFRARCIAYVSWIQRLSLTFSYVSLEASPKLFHRRSTIKCTWTLFMNFYLWAHYTCTFNSW